jgi:hypothetical protein
VQVIGRTEREREKKGEEKNWRYKENCKYYE